MKEPRHLVVTVPNRGDSFWFYTRPTDPIPPLSVTTRPFLKEVRSSDTSMCLLVRDVGGSTKGWEGVWSRGGGGGPFVLCQCRRLS